ncbi:flavodoxin family protein [Candidatus Bandiella numerosa]|uniref:flavodoxin family protein n=1 Tax=Candidatus Bandiella numerosa TaxID=2570586 RepID=UPI00249E2560|nr:flavodoxin family protein [Candidatus Bandiella numerosa]WHA05136.1 flavodoxin family protein [Candidatus Bandiella numerosa]
MKKRIATIYDHENCFTKTLSKYIHIGIQSENVESKTYEAKFICENLQLLDEVDSIIFGTPTYFGNVSTNIKKLMDSTVDIWDNKGWNNKIAAGFTHSSALSGDKLGALMSIFIFAQQHGMMWIGVDLKSNETLKNFDVKLNRLGSWMGLMTESPSKDKEPEINVSDIKTAEYFGARIAKITKKFQ